MAAASPRIAIVGGGIAGTLCGLVLKNRGLTPKILDAGRNGVGGRLRGAPFLRAENPKLAAVCNMLEREGLLQRWNGRFGVLGSSGGGFLPAEIVTSTGVGGMQKQNDDEDDDSQTVGGRSAASDGGDFCHFADGSKAPTYSLLTDLCPNICRYSKIDTVSDARVVGAVPDSEAGGWNVTVQRGNGDIDEESFDGMVLATHDASFAGGIVRSIADSEALAGGYETTTDAAAENVSIVVRLLGLSDALDIVRKEGRMPVYTISIDFPSGTGKSMPFDAATVPGSHLVQFLDREASKPNTEQDVERERWTAISTSQYASSLLESAELSSEERLSEASDILSQEVCKLLSPFHSELKPLDVSAKQWGAAFTSMSLGLKEDSIALAPWRLAICGDFIRDMSEYSSPLEAAALSGIEAGERTASFFQQQ